MTCEQASLSLPVRERAATLVVASQTLVAQLAMAGEDPASVGLNCLQVNRG